VTGVMESGKLVFEGFGSLIAPGLLAIAGVRGALFVAGRHAAGRRGIDPPRLRTDRDRAVRPRRDPRAAAEGPLFDPLRVDALGVAAPATHRATRAG